MKATAIGWPGSLAFDGLYNIAASGCARRRMPQRDIKPVAKRLKERAGPHKLVIITITRRLVTIANAIIKTGTRWQSQRGV